MNNTYMKQFQIQFFNSMSKKEFILPTIFTDRVEACVHGQDYCRDRQDEDDTILFFRVVNYIETNEEEEDEDECLYPEREDCDGCPYYDECLYGN